VLDRNFVEFSVIFFTFVNMISGSGSGGKNPDSTGLGLGAILSPESPLGSGLGSVKPAPDPTRCHPYA
jgi:hypothetical protein